MFIIIIILKLWCDRLQDFFFLLRRSLPQKPALLLPYSRLACYLLCLFLYIISFLMFLCRSVWENTRAWVPHFQCHAQWCLLFLSCVVIYLPPQQLALDQLDLVNVKLNDFIWTERYAPIFVLLTVIWIPQGGTSNPPPRGLWRTPGPGVAHCSTIFFIIRP